MGKLVEPTKFDEKQQARMRVGYWLTGWGTGPDTVMLSIWQLGMIGVASSDSFCGAYDGYASGADGQRCTAESDWNETIWEASGGSACLQASGFLLDAKYLHDTSLPGCGAALSSYRATIAYTCNCTGDHSYTSIGWRGSNVVIFAINIISAAVAVIGLFLGAYLDYSHKRMFVWKLLYAIGVVCTLGMSVVSGNNLWIVGLVFCILTHIATELTITPRASYMNYIAHDDTTRMKLGGMRQFTSYGSQALYLIIMLPCTLFLSSSLLSLAAAALCGIWYAIFMWPAFLRLPPIGPTLEPESGSRFGNAFSDVFSEIPVMFKKYPEIPKYFLFIICAQNGGASTVLAVNGPYGTFHGLGAFELGILALIVLVLGIGFAYLFAKLSEKRKLVSFKKTWLLIMLYFLLIGALVPALVTNDNSYMMRLIFIYILAGVFAALGLSWYYSLGWPVFVTMCPKEKVQLYSSYLNAVNIGFSWIGSTTYAAIVQATNNHRLAWASMCGFNIVGCLILLTVNFDKARRDAGNDLADGKPATVSP